MKNLKRLSAVLALTFVLALSAFAGEMNSPPCPPPDPGEMNSPPCTSAQELPDDSLAPGQTNSASTVAIIVTDAAIDILQSVLSIF